MDDERRLASGFWTLDSRVWSVCFVRSDGWTDLVLVHESGVVERQALQSNRNPEAKGKLADI